MMDSTSPNTTPCTPSFNPQSNKGIDDLKDWITKQFPRSSISDTVECVTASSILNSLSSLGDFTPARENVSYTEDQILELCRSKFLEILGYCFDQHSIGGSLNFVPVNSLSKAFIDAQKQSVKHLNTLCGDSQYDVSKTTRLQDLILKFIGDAKVKIATKNESNILHYLELNKKIQLQNCHNAVRERFKILYQGPVLDNAPFSYYKSATLAVCLKTMISEAVKSWNNTINLAIPVSEGEGNNTHIPPPYYYDDVETSLNLYMNEVISANEERNINFLFKKLEKAFSICKLNIEKTINTTKFLDDITYDDINTLVTSYDEQFLRNNKIMMQTAVNSTTESQLKSKLQEKITELLNYGQSLVQTEFEKSLQAFHDGFNTELKKILEVQQGKHRLKRVLGYEQYAMKALGDFKRHCNYEQNTQAESTSGGASIQSSSEPCMSSIQISFRSKNKTGATNET